MSRQHHKLKTQTQYYQALENGYKCFEIRKNDRDFQVHDLVTLKEVVGDVYTHREMGPFEISYVFHGGKFGLEEGYVVFEMNMD